MCVVVLVAVLLCCCVFSVLSVFFFVCDQEVIMGFLNKAKARRILAALGS